MRKSFSILIVFVACFTTGLSTVNAARFEQFTRVTEGPHVNDAVHSMSVCWIDYNNDKYLDLVTNTSWPRSGSGGSPGSYHYVYQNNGDGTYTRIYQLDIVGNGGHGYGSSCSDYDNDGDIDILMTNFQVDTNYLYVNDGFGSFTIDSQSGISAENAGSTSPSWIDYDQNGLLDLFVCNSVDDDMSVWNPCANYLYKDVGGAFSKINTGVIATDVKKTYGASWCDYDNDGDPDLFIANNGMDGNDLYRNDGDGSFTSMTGSMLSLDSGYCQSNSWADYDNDGHMDLYVGNINLWGNDSGVPFLYHNDGDGTFTKVLGHNLHLNDSPVKQGVWGDYDNDGDLDIFITPFNKGNPTFIEGNLFENIDGSTFTKITDGVIAGDTQVVSSAVWGDYDRDGDLDLYTCRYDPTYKNNPIYSKNRLYRNNGNGNNWITIKPVGTSSNRSAIGTRIRLKANIGGSPVWQMRDIVSQTASRAQPPMEAHFGLGDATTIDSILIEWPSGIMQTVTDVAVNQFLILEES